MPKAAQHKWTKIAPDAGGDDDVVELIWEWCIRCGCLKLGHQVFAPGSWQTPVIHSLGDPGCQVRDR